MSQIQKNNGAPVWHINGFDFELDMQDADTLDRYEAAFVKMSENEKKLPKDGKASDRVRAYCNLFRMLYDDIFGAGSAEKILGTSNNARVVNEVYEQFLEFVNSQRSVIADTQNRLLERFSPNRAQRRAAAAKGKK